MSKRGFTMVELLVALVLLGIVSGAIYQLLASNQRIYQQQTQRVDLNSNLRATMALLPSEVRELNASDQLGGDIVAMSADTLVYRAMRALYVVCLTPTVTSATTGTVVLQTDPWFGLRALDGQRDAVLLFAEADRSTRTDNFWLHASVSGSVTLGTLCPNNRPSMTVGLANIDPANGLAGVEAGAPLRSYEVMKLKTYQDARGDVWLGAQSYSQSSGWLDLQPVLGPLAPQGMRFAYFDPQGAVTTDRAQVGRIQVTVIGQTRSRVRQGGEIRYVQDTLVTEIALRNNRH